MARVSVVIPFLNAERFLADAVGGVLAQTYDDWELLLVDDGSSDESSAIAHRFMREHPARVRRLEHPGHVNRGMSASRNLGVRHARGEFVAFLDSDDVWRPDKLATDVAVLEAHSRVAVVYGTYVQWRSWTGVPQDADMDELVRPGLATNRVVDPPELATRVWPLGDCPAGAPSALTFRKSALERVGGSEESFKGMYEDLALLFKVYLGEEVFLADGCWVFHREHPGACMATSGSEAGGYPAGHRVFLEWLGAYLVRTGERRPAVWAAYEEAIQPFWPERHPVRARLAPLLHRTRRRRRDATTLAPPSSSHPAGMPYEGTLDVVDCTRICGWARDPTSDRPVTVEIFDGFRRVATVTADRHRGDLEAAGIGTGHHGFQYHTPIELRDGRPHLIAARVAGTANMLGSSPRTLCCELQLVKDVKGLASKLQWPGSRSR
jgi:hypothetical protein